MYALHYDIDRHPSSLNLVVLTTQPFNKSCSRGRRRWLQIHEEYDSCLRFSFCTTVPLLKRYCLFFYGDYLLTIVERDYLFPVFDTCVLGVEANFMPS
jgi:hypothetical protein